MIKYYGTPITPNRIFDEIFEDGRNCLIPFPNPQNLKRAVGKCSKIIVDNGAFTLWRKGGNIDWDKYYSFIEKTIDELEFFFIPDVIDGSEEENDNLIFEYFEKYQKDYDYSIKGYCGINKLLKKGVPIWHINESFERLERLMNRFNYIAIGSAGEYRDLGTDKWHKRMNKTMKILCDKDGSPKVRIHMLRCLNPDIFLLYPFHSGDSTGLAQNHSRDGWRKIVAGIEKYNSPKQYTFKKYYETGSLF